MKRLPLLFIFVLLLSTFALAEKSANSSSYQISPNQIVQLKKIISSDGYAKSMYNKVLKAADKALNLSPDPIDKIQTEGKLDSDPAKKATQISLKDMPLTYSLGMAYILTDDARYANKAKEYLLAWAGVNQPTGDPIDETNLEPMIRTYELLKDQFMDSEKTAIETWLAHIADSEIYSRKKGKETSFNNWNSHRLKIIGLIAFTLKNQKYLDYTIQGFKKQIAEDLFPDGQSYDFQVRDALHYHCYTLEPLLTLCIDAKLNGLDLFNYVSPNGCSLQKSVEFLIPFVTGEKEHQEYVHSQVKFDRDRANAGQESFKIGRLFRAEESLNTLTEYYFFTPSLLPLIQKLKNNDSPYPSWNILIESVQRTLI